MNSIIIIIIVSTLVLLNFIIGLIIKIKNNKKVKIEYNLEDEDNIDSYTDEQKELIISNLYPLVNTNEKGIKLSKYNNSGIIPENRIKNNKIISTESMDISDYSVIENEPIKVDPNSSEINPYGKDDGHQDDAHEENYSKYTSIDFNHGGLTWDTDISDNIKDNLEVSEELIFSESEKPENYTPEISTGDNTQLEKELKQIEERASHK